MLVLYYHHIGYIKIYNSKAFFLLLTYYYQNPKTKSNHKLEYRKNTTFPPQKLGWLCIKNTTLILNINFKDYCLAYRITSALRNNLIGKESMMAKIWQLANLRSKLNISTLIALWSELSHTNITYLIPQIFNFNHIYIPLENNHGKWSHSETESEKFAYLGSIWYKIYIREYYQS